MNLHALATEIVHCIRNSMQDSALNQAEVVAVMLTAELGIKPTLREATQPKVGDEIRLGLYSTIVRAVDDESVSYVKFFGEELLDDKRLPMDEYCVAVKATLAIGATFHPAK